MGVLRQNKAGGLEIESDSRTSLRAVGTHLDRYDDLNWSEFQISYPLKGVLIRLRTKPARTTFRWAKGHEDNYGNNKADTLANAGSENDSLVKTTRTAIALLFKTARGFRPSRRAICTTRCLNGT